MFLIKVAMMIELQHLQVYEMKSMLEKQTNIKINKINLYIPAWRAIAPPLINIQNIKKIILLKLTLKNHQLSEIEH